MSMAKVSSSMSNNTTPSSSSVVDSYIGSFLSVTSKSEIRYEGVLYYLNPKDSTLGLQNVRSYGTEGRKKDGPQVPPSDRIYEYILFRGSDIKDLEVKTGPTAQIEEPMYKDPAIIQQSNYHVEPSSALQSVSAVSGPMPEINLYGETSALNVRSYPSVLPSHHSGDQLGQWSSVQSTHNAMSSYDMPIQWQEHSGTHGSIAGSHQHPSSSTTTFYPLQNQETTATNLFNNFSPGHSSATSSSLYIDSTPTLTSEQLSTPFTDSISSKSSLPYYHATLMSSNGLTMPFPVSYMNTSSIEAPYVNKVAPDHVLLPPALSSSHSTSSVSDPITDPLLRKQPTLLTPNQLSQPGLTEYSSERNLFTDQRDVDDDLSSISLKISSSAITPAVQPPLLPLPPPTEKLQYSSQFTEEFDFQAMNEKFRKDEVWGYLGKAKQTENIEGRQENVTRIQDLGDDNNRSVPNGEPKPAYNKDDFFDTISCNNIGRGARNGQNRSSDRMKLDSETFGNFRQRTQFGYDGYGARHGEHRGPYSWGRGYNYGNRGGRGGFRQR